MRQSALTFASRILTMFINFPISILIARKLGVEGQGAYSATVALTSFWGTGFLFGINTAHTYYLASRQYTLAQVMCHSLLWSVGLGLIATPLYLWVAPSMNQDGGEAFASVLTLSAFAVPLILFKYFLLSAFLGQQKVALYNLLNVFSSVALLLSLLVTLLWFPGGIYEAIVSYLISIAAFVIFGIIWVSRRVKTLPPPSLQLIRSSILYGIRGHIGHLAIQGTYRLDQILITAMTGLQAQGYYSISVLLAEKLSHIPTSIQLVLFPRVAATSEKDANHLTPMVCRTTLLLVTLVGLILFLLARPVISLLYTDAFLPAATALQILLPGVALHSVGKLVSSDLSGRDRRLGPSVIMVLAFLLNLICNLAWIPTYGIEGAAWASSLSYALQAIALAAFFSRVTGVPFHHLFLPRRSDLARVLSLLPGRRR